MDVVEFAVQGPAKEPYKTFFNLADGGFKARCTCAAGEIGVVCKHISAIAEGSAWAIVSENAEQRAIVAERFQWSQARITLKQIEEVEAEMGQLKALRQRIKRQLLEQICR